MQRTLYQLLGVSDTATAEQIREAYSRLQTRLRVRADGGDPDATNQLKFAHEAFTILSIPESRAQYDLKLATSKAATAQRPERPAPATNGKHPGTRHPSGEPTGSKFNVRVIGIVAAAVTIAALLFYFVSRPTQPTVEIGSDGQQVYETKLGRDAVTALKRLEAATEIGINYTQYSQELIDAFVPVKAYLESPEANDSPDLALQVAEAMDLYRVAREIWDYKIKNEDDWVGNKNYIYGNVVMVYPDAAGLVEDRFGRPSLNLSRALSHAWGRASVATSAAAGMVK